MGEQVVQAYLQPLPSGRCAQRALKYAVQDAGLREPRQQPGQWLGDGCCHVITQHLGPAGRLPIGKHRGEH